MPLASAGPEFLTELPSDPKFTTSLIPLSNYPYLKICLIWSSKANKMWPLFFLSSLNKQKKDCFFKLHWSCWYSYWALCLCVFFPHFFVCSDNYLSWNVQVFIFQDTWRMQVPKFWSLGCAIQQEYSICRWVWGEGYIQLAAVYEV